jgi:hypothetical protein
VDRDVETAVVGTSSVGTVVLSGIATRHPHMMPEIAANAAEQTSCRALR